MYLDHGGDYTRLGKILKDLHRSCENEDGR